MRGKKRKFTVLKSGSDKCNINYHSLLVREALRCQE